MTPEALRAAADRLLSEAGLGPAPDLAPLPGGANNRVFRVDTAAGPAVLKAYFHHPDDRRDRLAAEYGFSRLAWDGGVRALPRPLAQDRDNRLGLYAFVDGRKLEPGEVERTAVTQALDFHVAVNRLRAGADNLPMASEACFSLSDHLATVTRRLARLDRVDPDTSPEHRHAGLFVRDAVAPLWQSLDAAVRRAAAALGIDADAPLDPADRCLSPSDFGFHNALKAPDGTFRFLDFEYAGWDDPAKLVGDFFNQVAVPVPLDYYPAFRDAVAGGLSAPERHARRFDLLLPVYTVKWVTIMLNDFLPVGDSRRRFAGDPAEAAERRRRQLGKAEAAFTQLRDRLGRTDGPFPDLATITG